nr:MAG: putative coat protein [Leviviridae sp.]
MLGSTVTLTVNGNAKVLNLVNQDNFSGEYLLKEATEEWRLKVAHQRQSADKLTGVVYERHNATFTNTVFAVAGVSPELRRQFSTTWVMKAGDELPALYASNAVAAWLTASSSAKTVAILGWES